MPVPGKPVGGPNRAFVVRAAGTAVAIAFDAMRPTPDPLDGIDPGLD